MGYSKFISGIVLLSTLCCGVLFADYGIVDGISNDDITTSLNTSTSIQFPAGLSFALLRRHILLSNSVSSLTGSVSGPVDYIKMLEDGIRFDVIGALEFVDDKGVYLSGYLSNTAHVLSLIDGYTISLQDTIDRTNDQRKECIQQKKDADERFFASLSEFDQKATDAALQESMSAGSCEESTRISIVATTLQLRRIKQLHDILDAKQTLLSDNTTTIVTYFPLVKKELLQQLLVLSSKLQNYTTSLDQ